MRQDNAHVPYGERLKGKDVDPICGLPLRQTSHGFLFQVTAYRKKCAIDVILSADGS